MSLSPSFPHGAPSLAEVLISRTFAKPPQPFVDGEFIKALEGADDAPPSAEALARSQGADSSSPDTGSGAAPGDGASTPRSSDAGTAGRSVDVRV
jgi:hypothetical protein